MERPAVEQFLREAEAARDRLLNHRRQLCRALVRAGYRDLPLGRLALVQRDLEFIEAVIADERRRLGEDGRAGPGRW
ncbi:hypothetical protein M446_4063 [Methylobacterium sp. 4-46]|uniref:hypothetical protein n=1 Tax=unclassified Methylobacterium TaxID=2615210 RepID=UPI000165C806|nr:MULTISPECIES: hypothetical protein [Methylobacterium]ACA18421.1 hypothetical protein M446_4063 [Methylobacterium sp. 4-46]WFT77711.1 hypothetical protein QA634_20635 [Methylobacterium nodulans]